MTTLQEKLDEVRAGSRDRIPADALAVMHRATEDLRQSGISEQILAAGAMAPSFELENADGARVPSRELLANGPLIVTFYRGIW